MAQLVVVIALFVFMALSRGTISILSPILEAQAKERKRRETAADQSIKQQRIKTSSFAAALPPKAKDGPLLLRLTDRKVRRPSPLRIPVRRRWSDHTNLDIQSLLDSESFRRRRKSSSDADIENFKPIER